MTMIDMHAHWRPAEVADALRARTREPRIVRNPDGVEVLKSSRMSEEPLAKAFDDVDFHLARMDRQGVETSVREAFNLDLASVVVRECCWSGDPAAHAYSLDKAMKMYARIRSLEQVAAMLRQ